MTEALGLLTAVQPGGQEVSENVEVWSNCTGIREKTIGAELELFSKTRQYLHLIRNIIYRWINAGVKQRSAIVNVRAVSTKY